MGSWRSGRDICPGRHGIYIFLLLLYIQAISISDRSGGPRDVELDIHFIPLMNIFISIMTYMPDAVLVATFALNRRRLFWEPLAGGNHKVQMDEAGKALILFVFYMSARAEMLRDRIEPVFSDSYWFAILGSVALIAGIKEAKGLFGKTQDTTTTG